MPRQCWTDPLLYFPHAITQNVKKKFAGCAFAKDVNLLHIGTKSVPLKSGNLMSIVERYDSPLRREFFIIKNEAPDAKNDYRLLLVVKVIKIIISSNGFVSILFVFGVLKRLENLTVQPASSAFERGVALQKMADSRTRNFARRYVRDPMSTRNDPIIIDSHITPIGMAVPIYWPKKDK